MKYKVIHVIDKLSVAGSGVHGVTKIVEKWITNFDREKYEFLVVSLREEEEAGKLFAQSGIPIKFFSRGKFDLRTITDLLKIIRQEKVDLLHLHGYSASNFGRLVSFATGIPNIVHEHAILLNQPFYQTIADSILAPITAKAIAVSKGVASFMKDYRKIHEKKIEVIFNGIEIDNFKQPTQNEVDDERERLNLPVGAKVICTTGRLDSIKGLPFLIQAAQIVIEQDSNVYFLIVGEGPDKEKLKELTIELKISKNIIFTGFHNEVEKCLALSNIFVMTSLSEGMPISILEAMNMEMPIVAFPASGVNEIIINNQNGILVPMKDYKSLSKKIIELLKDENKSKKLGERAKLDVQQYNIVKSAEIISKIYQSLLSNREK